MGEKLRLNFAKALTELQNDILRMGGLVEEAIAKSIESLEKRDISLAKEVIAGDEVIDNLELKIEGQCMKLIVTQQPMATDLRRIGSGFKIITDLERMADYAGDIADIVTCIAHEPLIKPLIDIPKMAEITQSMVRDSLDAYVREDIDLVYEMARRDDEVDRLHRQVFDELQVYMSKDPATIYQATYLLFISRYLERIADHATNIGERVLFLVTGERVDLNS